MRRKKRTNGELCDVRDIRFQPTICTQETVALLPLVHLLSAFVRLTLTICDLIAERVFQATMCSHHEWYRR